MRDPNWEWLEWAMYRGCGVRGLRLFWQGQTIWLLLGLFMFVNLLIPIRIMVRSFRRSVIDRDFPH